MSLIRWDPFGEMHQLRGQVNTLFEQMLARQGQDRAYSQTWAPSVDILETDTTIVLHVEVAGIKPEDIDIAITGDTLTIKGERKAEQEEHGKQYVRIERSYGAFQRSFTLGVSIDQAGVKATSKDGVLEITLPKREEVKPKQVKVEVHPTLEAAEVAGK